MNTPILETERLLLRPLAVSDAEHIFSCWASDPVATKYMTWDTHTDVTMTKEWLGMEETAIPDKNHFVWGFVLKDENILIGSGGITFRSGDNHHELGYIIAKPYWNRGLVSEAVAAMISFIKEKTDIRVIHAKHAVDNTASGRIIEKNGFSFQCAGSYTSFSGTKTYDCREYVLHL